MIFKNSLNRKQLTILALESYKNYDLLNYFKIINNNIKETDFKYFLNSSRPYSINECLWHNNGYLYIETTIIIKLDNFGINFIYIDGEFKEILYSNKKSDKDKINKLQCKIIEFINIKDESDGKINS